MSINYDIFPTVKSCIPVEVIHKELDKVMSFIYDYNCEINIDIKDINSNSLLYYNKTLSRDINNYIIIKMKNVGEIYVFNNTVSDIDIDFWNTEMTENKNAVKLIDEINKNIIVGYYWTVKKTISQPKMIEPLFDCVTMIIANLSKGIVYTDDGAIEYEKVPLMYYDYKKEILHKYNLEE